MNTYIPDSSSECGSYEVILKTNIPDRFYSIDVTFGFVLDIKLPKQDPNEDNTYYIMVSTFYRDHTIRIVKEYRISLYEPKYIYESDRLPDDIKDIVAKTIMENYKAGLDGINKMEAKIIFDIDRPIPDYTKLP